MIEKERWRSYTLDEERDAEKDSIVIPVRLNPKERKMLLEIKKALQQPKDATALKQAFKIGHYVIQDSLHGKIWGYFSNNLRKNERLGIAEVEK